MVLLAAAPPWVWVRRLDQHKASRRGAYQTYVLEHTDGLMGFNVSTTCYLPVQFQPQRPRLELVESFSITKAWEIRLYGELSPKGNFPQREFQMWEQLERDNS